MLGDAYANADDYEKDEWIKKANNVYEQYAKNEGIDLANNPNALKSENITYALSTDGATYDLLSQIKENPSSATPSQVAEIVSNYEGGTDRSGFKKGFAELMWGEDSFLGEMGSDKETWFTGVWNEVRDNKNTTLRDINKQGYQTGHSNLLGVPRWNERLNMSEDEWNETYGADWVRKMKGPHVRD